MGLVPLLDDDLLPIVVNTPFLLGYAGLLFFAFPLFILAFGSIFIGYVTRDMMIGPGTDFWGNALFTLPDQLYLLEGEWINSLFESDKSRIKVSTKFPNYSKKLNYLRKNNVEILCGKLSKDKLIEKIGNQVVNCKIEKNKDQYSRLIGECFLKNESLSVFMVKNGYAFDYPKYSNGKFKKYQVFAKKFSLGLWQMQFEYPWIWRKKNR